MESFIFAQHKPCTFDFWNEYLYNKDVNNWNNVPLEFFPHYHFVQGNQDYYRSYLNSSWNHISNKKIRIEKQIKNFENFIQYLKKTKNHKPIIILERKDGKQLVIDGNHRLSILTSLNYRIPIKKINTKDYITEVLKSCKTRFGANNGIPYQSLQINDYYLEGRRTNIGERNKFIRNSDLKNCTVLDFGCNLGESSRYAESQGASVYIVDLKEIMRASLRIATVTNQLLIPYDRLEHYDTGFFFSVHRHVKIQNSILKCNNIYFETHVKDKGKLPDFLKDWKAEKLTELDDNRFFYRLENPYKKERLF